ncbi:MAG TPA: hypothetical protein VFD59_10600 [Nocardioidaceae bacterium]|nr:hypothetical protein [Nocardioidaceae bacterium]
MEKEFWYGLVFGFGGFALSTVVLVVVINQFGAFWRARIARREEAQDRALIERYEQLAGEQNRVHTAAATDLADVRERLTEIERLLREVE